MKYLNTLLFLIVILFSLNKALFTLIIIVFIHLCEDRHTNFQKGILMESGITTIYTISWNTLISSPLIKIINFLSCIISYFFSEIGLFILFIQVFVIITVRKLDFLVVFNCLDNNLFDNITYSKSKISKLKYNNPIQSILLQYDKENDNKQQLISENKSSQEDSSSRYNGNNNSIYEDNNTLKSIVMLNNVNSKVNNLIDKYDNYFNNQVEIKVSPQLKENKIGLNNNEDNEMFSALLIIILTEIMFTFFVVYPLTCFIILFNNDYMVFVEIISISKILIILNLVSKTYIHINDLYQVIGIESKDKKTVNREKNKARVSDTSLLSKKSKFTKSKRTFTIKNSIYSYICLFCILDLTTSIVYSYLESYVVDLDNSFIKHIGSIILKDIGLLLFFFISLELEKFEYLNYNPNKSDKQLTKKQKNYYINKLNNLFTNYSELINHVAFMKLYLILINTSN